MSGNFKFDLNPKLKSKLNFESNQIGGLNSVPTAHHANNRLFNIDIALDEENLEMGAVRGKDEIEYDEEAVESSDKAVKSDNAKVPVHLWDDCIAAQHSLHLQDNCIWSKRWNFRRKRSREVLDNLCRHLRIFALKVWKTRVRKSFIKWYEEEERHLPDAGGIWESGIVAVQRAEAYTW